MTWLIDFGSSDLALAQRVLRIPPPCFMGIQLPKSDPNERWCTTLLVDVGGR